LEIGGIQIGIEVPHAYPWLWPNGPISEFTCLPRSPEVHVGVRVGSVGGDRLDGERYGVGPWTFEVARRGDDWVLGLERRGVREQLAIFDGEFESGEVVVSPGRATDPDFPLCTPLDEWIVVHRTIARGGLSLTASAVAIDGHASVLLGTPGAAGRAANRWVTPTAGLLGRHTLLLREVAGRLRVFRTPWSDATDPALGSSARVLEVVELEHAVRSFREQLDPAEAAELLVAHSAVPLCDESLLDRVLRNTRSIGEAARVLRLGQPSDEPAPMPWRSSQLQGAFAPPRAEF